MDTKTFSTTPLARLEELTGIDRSNWSKYFNGMLLSEATLNRAALALEMEPHKLLKAINARRVAVKKTGCENSPLELV